MATLSATPLLYPGEGLEGPPVNGNQVINVGRAEFGGDLRGASVSAAATKYAIVFQMETGATISWTTDDEDARDQVWTDLLAEAAVQLS